MSASAELIENTQMSGLDPISCSIQAFSGNSKLYFRELGSAGLDGGILFDARLSTQLLIEFLDLGQNRGIG
jgi:hypothetical protein